MEAGKKNLSVILNRTTILKIPHFQRSYVWKEDQWNRFLEDIKYVSRTSRPYFMGSIILKQQETVMGEGANDSRTVVDGQQRLTSFFLFFRALFEVNDNLPEFKTICFTHSNELLLEHNYLDKSIFNKILEGKNLSDNDKTKQVYKCYKYFSDNIKKGEVDPYLLLSKIMFVGIDLQKEDDEQQIFDTINSLGVSLTTSELLKNYLFREDINSYIENWRRIFEKNDEIREYWDRKVTLGRNKRSNIDLFLQSYLFVKVYDPHINVKSEDKERFIKIDSVFNSFKELIDNYGLDKNIVINEIKAFAAVYKKIINPAIEDDEFEKDDCVQRLNLVMFGLETVTIIPYVLYVSKYAADENERNAIFQYLETYLVRRIICRFTSKNYNQLFRSLINNEIKSVSELKEFVDKKSDQLNHLPTDTELKAGFHDSQINNKQAKGVLYLIERRTRSERNATELRSAGEYSLEHVMPKKWRNNWDGTTLDEEQKEERDRLLLTLGNLTIITKKLNSSIRDSDWKIKKVGRGNKHGLNEYAAGIEIFNNYLLRGFWDEELIKERADTLNNLAKEIWPL